MISVDNIVKRFGAHMALGGVSLEIANGELVALLGPSGGGKTTLLRILAGLEAPDSGVVRIDKNDVSKLGVSERGVGFVFQHYALFREMTVFENVAFGLRVRPKATRPDEKKIRERVHELLSLVQLEGLAGRHPDQLSGGQRQRVALARALAVEPRVLLLDEPFGSLDARVRRELRAWLKRLHDELDVTSILVTHDQEEAFDVADRVVVISRGRIEQQGTPEELLRQPATEFVRTFLSEATIADAIVEGDGQVRIPAFKPEGAEGLAAGEHIKVVVRGARVLERGS